MNLNETTEKTLKELDICDMDTIVLALEQLAEIKAKPSTPFRKLAGVLHERNAIPHYNPNSALRFITEDGERISAKSFKTLNELGINDMDKISVNYFMAAG
ncbi:hypothetical protein H9P43_004509 [Blastocladiella emersonii ATCC 22665]|nr:hypothetical protein H9P43_004509 [Blastocladiella emersonii ATCC 22665]